MIAHGHIAACGCCGPLRGSDLLTPFTRGSRPGLTSQPALSRRWSICRRSRTS